MLWFYFVSKMASLPGGVRSWPANLTHLGANSEPSHRQPGWKVQQNEGCRLTLSFLLPLTHGGTFRTHRHLVIFPPGRLQRATLTAVGPRRRGPAGLEWSWERTAKLLLPPAALRRARGSCHRPCGWGSEHTSNQPPGRRAKPLQTSHLSV